VRSRVLHRDQWGELQGLPLAAVVPVLPPGAQVVVVEDHGVIVGTWAVVPYLHVEGLWVDPRYQRRGGVLRRLMHGVRDVCGRIGICKVLTASEDDQVTEYLTRRGAAQLPGAHFVLETSCL